MIVRRKGIIGVGSVEVCAWAGEALLDVEVHPDRVAAVAATTEDGASDA
jgi:hypothetical protein